MYVIFTVGRLISGPFIEKLGYYTSMFTSIIGCFVFLLVGFCVGRAGIFFFAVTGFFYSSFWPIFICIVMRLFKKDSAVATSVILVVQGVIMLPANYILGLINEHVGVQWAYRGSMFLCFWSFCVMLFIHRTQKKIDAKVKSEGVGMSTLNDRPKKDSGDGKDVVVEMVTPVPPATKEEGSGSSESAAASQVDHLASTVAASVEGAQTDSKAPSESVYTIAEKACGCLLHQSVSVIQGFAFVDTCDSLMLEGERKHDLKVRWNNTHV